MAINFPDSPNNGDIYTVNGKKWIYDGGKWSSYGLALAPDVLKVDSVNNRVGVNNLSPSVDLDVTGNAAVSGSLTVDGDLTISGNTTTLNTTELYVEDNKVTLNSGATGSATANAGIEVERGDDPNVEILWDESADAWKIATDFTVDTNTLHVDSTNNRVGIGTTIPNETLDVQGSIGFSTGGGRTAGSLFSDSNWGLITTAAQSSPAIAEFAWFNADDTERMRIDTSGKVGIGDTTPSYTLDVNGDINATGEVRTNGNPVGLVHIKSVSVPSGSGSITVTGITGYADYLLRFDRVDCSGNAVLIIDSADLSGFQWYGSALLWQGTATPLAYDLGGASSSGAYAGLIGTNRSSLLLHIFNPGGAGRTRYYSQGVYSTAHFHAGGVYNADTTTDQFTFSMSGSNTLSGGTIEVYGYNQ